MKKNIFILIYLFHIFQLLFSTGLSASNNLSDKSENDEIILNFRFTIPDTLNPVKFQFLLWTAPGISDVKEQTGEIVKNNNEYQFISGGYLFPITHNGLEIAFMLTKNEYENISYIRVIAEEANGIKSEIGIYNVK